MGVKKWTGIKMDTRAFLEREIKEAEEMEQGFFLGFDSNCHLGPSVIKNDPMSGPNKNGQRFLDFLERNPCLIVVNSLKLCQGTITRKRTSLMKDDNL